MAGLVVVALALAGAAWHFRPVDHGAPAVLPDAVLGLPQASSDVDFSQSPWWLEEMPVKYPGTTLAGRGYSLGLRHRPLMANVIVMRDDMSGVLDLRLVTKPYVTVGRVTCSRTWDLGEALGRPSNPGRLDGEAVCWRTSRGLSVSLTVLGAEDLTDADVAAEVQRVWDLQP